LRGACGGCEGPAAGLTPGVASSVAPSGMPVAPTGAPGPNPSGEVTPSELGAPVNHADLGEGGVATQ
jgi:hypothetical protein